jgi:hypothetical protein
VVVLRAVLRLKNSLANNAIREHKFFAYLFSLPFGEKRKNQFSCEEGALATIIKEKITVFPALIDCSERTAVACQQCSPDNIAI